MSLFEDTREMFFELDDGCYIVRIDGFKRERGVHHGYPIRWDLSLMNDLDVSLPIKYSHIDTITGFKRLMKELADLGLRKPTTPEELEATLYSMKGMIVEAQVSTSINEHVNRDISFIRRIAG